MKKLFFPCLAALAVLVACTEGVILLIVCVAFSVVYFRGTSKEENE